VILIRQDLLKVHHSFCIGRVNHNVAVKTIAPETRHSSDHFAEGRELFLRKALRAIDNEKPPLFAASIRPMLDAVVKHDYIAGPGVQSNGGDLRRMHVPQLTGSFEGTVQPVGVGVPEHVAPGNYAQASCIGIQWVQVESELECLNAAEKRLGMPQGVTGIVVTVGGAVVKIISQESPRDPHDPFVIQQCAKSRVLVNERHHTGSLFPGMNLPVVAATIASPHLFESIRDLLYGILYQAIESQEPEGFEKVALLVREFHGELSLTFYPVGILPPQYSLCNSSDPYFSILIALGLAGDPASIFQQPPS
jgi:hypothetical protein